MSYVLGTKAATEMGARMTEMDGSTRTLEARALSDAWVRTLDESARRVLGPHDRRGDALAAEVARLSELYTRDRGALRTQSAALAPRMRFFLPRDLPKIEGPLAELAHEGELPRGPRWRVLDLGAGLGTSTLGVATFARRVEGIEGIDAIAIERDARSLDVMRELASRCGKGELAGDTVPITLDGRELDLERFDPRGLIARGGARFSLVVIGLALNELWIDAPDRIDRRATLLQRCAEVIEDDGAIVVIEPGSKDSARELQRVRDAIVALGRPHVVAPCTRGADCPMLRNDRDWCHADLPLALPDPLRAIARGAGLRWEGLSYAYLLLRRQPRAIDPRRYRIVGGPIASKGRTEWHGCGAAGLIRIARLERHREDGVPMDGAARGSIVAIDAPLAEGDIVRTDRVPITRER
jgi:SAM-dependent methyltransferase